MKARVPGFLPTLEEWEDCPHCDGAPTPPCPSPMCNDGLCQCDCGDEHDCHECDGAGLGSPCWRCEGTGNVATRCFKYLVPSRLVKGSSTHIVVGCGGRGWVVTGTGAFADCSRCRLVREAAEVG